MSTVVAFPLTQYFLPYGKTDLYSCLSNLQVRSGKILIMCTGSLDYYVYLVKGNSEK